MNTTPKQPPAPPTGASSGGAHRRTVDLPVPAPRRPSVGESRGGAADARKMFIGREIVISGDIASCDQLLLEGTAEAKLRESRHLEVTDTGLFKGTAEVDDADIAGRFEGELIVHGRLRVRATGSIEGRIQYGELEVESGGRMIGDIQVSAVPRASAPFEPSRLSGFPSVPPASAASRAASQDGGAPAV